MNEISTVPVQDPFLFDSEQLASVAEEPVIREGISWCRENRVTQLDQEERRLWARVEDAGTQDKVGLELAYDPDGNLAISCECGAHGQTLCVHGVAALCAYASRAGESGELLGAVEQAIEERVKRGRTEVRVKHLSGEPWFGTWRATSVNASGPFPRGYQVNIRSLERRGNYCTCPDFATNQLGTCKHIEAVLHSISKRRDYPKLKGQSVPYPYVYLAWDVADAPRIALYRVDNPSQDLGTLLDEYFDSAGLFKGRLPDDFYRFEEQVRGRDDLNLGEDAREHVVHLAAAVAHRVRAREIRGRIESTGGRLPGVRARLYPYQVEGVAFLAANGRALLADDMGLGKTLQAISAATWLREHAEVERVLVVCPASLKHQWAREIQKFTGLDSQVVQGAPDARRVQYRRGNGFFIINYELVLRDLSVINETLHPDLVILDEAQRIKNWRTKVATAVKMIPSRYAFVLTGTPLENRLEDLYSLMQVVDPRVLGPLWRYLIDFHVTDERGKVLSYRNLTELRRRLASVMLRRDRSLVRAQLPERIEQRLDIQLTPRQQELHDGAMQGAGILAQRARHRALTPAEQNKLMALLQQARMACDAAGLVDNETEGSPKLDELASVMEELCIQSGMKAVVFSQWERMTRMVETQLRRMGIGSVRLHGGVPTHKRGELMDRFREDDAVQVFISTDAGGVGLNLQNASVLVNLDIPWNPAILDQRIARVHRLGQTGTVQVVLMVASDAYEETVLRLVQNKRDLFDNVVDPDATQDVVGVSRKLLNALVEDLNAPETRAVEVGEPAPPEEAATPAAAGGVVPGKEEAPELPIRQAIESIQAAFGPRIERILGTGGGLLVVMDRVDDAADRTAAGLGGGIPIALIEPRTLNGLQRLGAASPLGETQTYFDAAEGAAPAGGARLAALSREKLKAAEVLAGQDCPDAALELLVSSLLAAAAARLERDQPPGPRDAAVWLYGEAIPKGAVSQEQAALIMRGVALSQADSVPEALFTGLLEDVRGFVSGAA